MKYRKWTVDEARVLCQVFLEVVKEPVPVTDEILCQIAREWRRNMRAHGKREASRTATSKNVRNILVRVRRSILELRKRRPSTPHQSEELELEWIKNWCRSGVSTCHYRVSSVLLVFWKMLKDAPQIEEVSRTSNASSLSTPQHKHHASTVASRESKRSSDQTWSRQNEKVSKNNPERDGKKEEKLVGQDPPAAHRKDDRVMSGSFSSVSDVDGHSNRERQHDRKWEQPAQPRTRICTRSKKRKHREQSASDDKHSGHNPSDSGSPGTPLNHAADAQTRSTRSRTRSRSRNSDDSSSRCERKSSHTSTDTDMSASQKKVKLLRCKLKLAKLERRCQDLRIQELHLKVQLAEAVKELEESRRHRSM
mmetsp:Transcript_9310/g.25249  ORF Transcript_9310/g.25249 Transcript_9310/m.25249 type:complete len:365 (-) Transcript_9310:365-1459(-)|eukprot:CAMPEP_0198116908 /NCGR_PEP_ID=MMETSP1442-20131203/15377_1 /TAXON_ID= /ORGANISM="Craspedostauros australis, Strain CCMP3328" /LENGTH=364 /DNA_ID=CAMNT_0043774839 /DNA_START=123 /DNA_END=1217 /DNA_ORIENTATION=+